MCTDFNMSGSLSLSSKKDKMSHSPFANPGMDRDVNTSRANHKKIFQLWA